MMEVDAVRKEIVTLKKINLQLEEEKKIVDNKYATEILESQRYDQQIAVKNEQLQKKKIEGMHLKTETIKNYDNLLKKLEQELGQKTEGTNESRKEEFYLTGS